MSGRRLVPAVLAAAALVTPAAASARVADVHAIGSHRPTPPETFAPITPRDAPGGLGSGGAIVLAGCTLLVGAITGFEGGRVVGRRRALAH
jgi:hypothetical protein